MKASVVLAVCLSYGCSGAIGTPPSAAGGGGSNPGARPLRRLNRVEYNNTIRDLLGDTMPPADNFPPDDEGLGFTNNADAMVVTGLLAQSYIDAAEAMATVAVTKLSTLSSCQVAQSGEDMCSRQFITSFGKRAFRRPLTDEEITRYVGLFATGKQGGTYEDGIAWLCRRCCSRRISCTGSRAPRLRLGRPSLGLALRDGVADVVLPLGVNA